MEHPARAGKPDRPVDRGARAGRQPHRRFARIPARERRARVASRRAPGGTGARPEPLVTLALDSWVILAWLKDQAPGAGVMAGLWEQAEAGRAQLVMNIVNLGEVFYRSEERRVGKECRSRW